MKIKYGSFFIYTFTAVMAVYFSMDMWKGKYDVKMASTRDPAAINRKYDFSHLRGKAFQSASRTRLLKDAHIIQGNDSVAIQLGHFVTRARGGERAFACHVFDKIELKFIAADMAINGEPATMTVDTRCEVSKDIASMKPIWIPMSKILKQPVGEVELLFFKETPLALRFQNIDSDWPLMWNLTSVRLYSNSKPGLEVIVGQRQILELHKGPIAFSWEQ